MSEPHEHLNERMNTRRLELRLEWNQVADIVGVTTAALRNIRTGKSRPAELTALGLDAALQWEPGSVDRVLRGGEPKPLQETQSARPAVRAGMDAADAIRAAQQTELERLRAKVERQDEVIATLFDQVRALREERGA